MIIISTLGKMHENTIGYGYEDLITYLGELKVKNLIITYTSRHNYNMKQDEFREIKLLENSFNVFFPEIDYDKYNELLTRYSLETHNAEEVTKKNIVDIIETVINSYLKGYWKSPETVNSEVTDSIYRVKNKFIQSVNPEYIEKYWLPLHMDVYNYIETNKNKYDAVISDVESAFFYKEEKL
ncbi:hypothetical protein [Ferroplasma acidarmanus]|uniref:Uncharacterized protein n=1 Tax=Ferroplasma acidarmanus Fer1 TaxID=333146 RepID=S0ARM6_FERAC|nr:hypothetical protein [Ferroplasma acidarmanus]AGO61442.1 hypothetical protein FACI_IFERC00001G1462 [Ferroplasma acidarmanus Fer1]